MTEQRVAALEAQIVELRDANLQLKGALDEQRAQAAATQPAQQQVGWLADWSASWWAG